MKIALVGIGYWGINLLRNLVRLPGNSVVVYEQDIKRAEEIKRDYPSLGFIEKPVSFSNDDSEAVVIATPPDTHYRIVKDALLSGKHVFVEKPMTTKEDQAVELEGIAASRNLVLMVGHTFLFSPEVREIKKIIHSGQLGGLLHIESNRKNLGKFQDSGVIWDLAPHDLAMLFYLTGMGPLHFTSRVDTVSHIRNGVPDTATIHLLSKFTNFSYQLNLSWLHPLKIRTTYFVGTQQMLVYDMMAKNKITIVDRHVEAHSGGYRHVDGPVTEIPVLDTEEPLLKEMREFIIAIESGGSYISDANMGVRVVSAISSFLV